MDLNKITSLVRVRGMNALTHKMAIPIDNSKLRLPDKGQFKSLMFVRNGFDITLIRKVTS